MHLLERCLGYLSVFPERTVLGVGDVMLDQYRRGRAVGLSPEAPAVELLNPDLRETPGGAANVAWNIGHLGGLVRLLGVVGRDREAETLRRLLTETPGVSFVPVEDPSRPTTLKLRFYHQQFQVLRVNQESKEPFSHGVEERCREMVLHHVEGCDAVFVEDYGKRLVSPTMVDTLLELRRARPNLPVILDPKIGNHSVYRPGMCTLMKPNWQEACQLLGEDPDAAEYHAVAPSLAEKYETDVLVTLGGRGVFLFERVRNHGLHIPTRPREAFDVAGAGDTTLAVVTLARAAGASLTDAALLANLAGGLVVEKSGTAYVTPEELAAELRDPKTRETVALLEQELSALRS